MINRNKVNIDSRGQLIELMDKPYHINYIEIKRGYARGGHYHKYPEKFLLLKGFVVVYEANSSDDEDLEALHLKVGEVFTTTPGIPHMFYSPDTDSVVLEVRQGGTKFKSWSYEPFRSFVEYLKSHRGPKYIKTSTIMGRRK